jgi:dolichol kinase
MVALAIMAFADPAAAMIGRRWGRTTLLHGRTLEGSLTFVVVGTAAALLGMHILHPEVCSWPMTLAVGACAAVCGSIAELFSRGLDDNLTVPVSAAAGTVLAAWLTGMPMWG